MFSAALKSGAASAPTDPKFNYVTMLLHGDGTNGAQNNTFLDSSSNAFSITRNGNTTQGTFSPYGANWSVQAVSSSSNYLTVGSTVALGSSDYTVEFWFAGDNFELSWGTPGAYSPIIINSSGDLYFSNSTNSGFSGSAPAVSGFIVKDGSWNHYAIVRQSGAGKVFRNGTQIATPTLPSSNATNGNVVIGFYNSGMGGYVSNFRAVVGTAVYTSAFTPPTAPLTAITNTKLLTCQSNRFIDNSSNAYTITPSGSPSVQRFSPFAPTSAYSASVIGGSGYFDGSGDTVSYTPGSSKDLGSGDFCIEFWVYANSWTSTTSYSIAQFYSPVDVGYGLSDAFSISSDPTFAGALMLYNWGGGSSDGTVVSYALSNLATKTWYHIAFTRSSGTTRMFVNGVQVSSSTKTYLGNFGSNPLYIGGGPGNSWFNGYLSDFRVVKGNAVYTSGFTVPTAPISAISGTVVMLNMTNAGILDNAEMNDLETVGTAQISTSVKKYGTGSMYFQGSNSGSQIQDNRLDVYPISNNWTFRTGDFTIEFWAYRTADFPGDSPIICSENPTRNWLIQWNNSQFQMQSAYAGGYIDLTSSGATTTNTWYHCALVRTSGTLKFFLNGNQTYSGSFSYDMNVVSALQIGSHKSSNSDLLYMDDIRITKGYARYTANFTPPTAAFPNN